MYVLFNFIYSDNLLTYVFAQISKQIHIKKLILNLTVFADSAFVTV